MRPQFDTLSCVSACDVWHVSTWVTCYTPRLMGHGTQPMTHGTWLMTHDAQVTSCCTWVVVHDIWLMGHDTWLTVHDMQLMVHSSWVMVHNLWLKIYNTQLMHLWQGVINPWEISITYPDEIGNFITACFWCTHLFVNCEFHHKYSTMTHPGWDILAVFLLNIINIIVVFHYGT
jgi:hypothetical protein